ncbi:flavin reductase family protein [Streptomyces sp. ACA25]|uniref:flavin reductase family protein n=1 Tax=Streptomyces sp. ACA25 TaxID=3022596 RepID=UPI00230810DA|nr:flavin reductase family protein [Streptomyces sp. ACA25]MDB1089312.1 flavin reductase family protein [Streptomyces sp. ACA25]
MSASVTTGPVGTGPALLRAAFRRHAAGVAVITVDGEHGPAGFTATSVASVSAEPPMVSFGAGTMSSSWPALAGARWVGVHLLAEQHRELAVRFSRSGADRFAAPTRWYSGPHGVPMLEGVPASLVCRVIARVPAGSHRVVLAEVVEGHTSRGGRPLLYHGGRYAGLRQESAEDPP